MEGPLSMQNRSSRRTFVSQAWHEVNLVDPGRKGIISSCVVLIMAEAPDECPVSTGECGESVCMSVPTKSARVSVRPQALQLVLSEWHFCLIGGTVHCIGVCSSFRSFQWEVLWMDEIHSPPQEP